jgi:hypothetical protein
MGSIPPEIFFRDTGSPLSGLSKSLFAKALHPAIRVPFGSNIYPRTALKNVHKWLIFQ